MKEKLLELTTDIESLIKDKQQSNVKIYELKKRNN